MLSFSNVAQAQNPDFVSAVINEIIMVPMHEQLVHDNTVLSQQSGSEFEIRATFDNDRLHKILLRSRRTGALLHSLELKYGSAGQLKNVPIAIIVGNEVFNTVSYWLYMQTIIKEASAQIQWDAMSGDINSEANRARIKVAAEIMQSRIASLAQGFTEKLSHLIRTNFSAPEMAAMDRHNESSISFLETESEAKDPEAKHDIIAEKQKKLSIWTRRLTLLISAGLVFWGANEYVDGAFFTNGPMWKIGLGSFIFGTWATLRVFDVSIHAANFCRKVFGEGPTEIVISAIQRRRDQKKKAVDAKALQVLMNQKIGNTRLQLSQTADAPGHRIARVVSQFSKASHDGSSEGSYNQILQSHGGVIPYGSAFLSAVSGNNEAYLIHVTTLGSTGHIPIGQSARIAAYEVEVIRTALKRAIRLALSNKLITTLIIPSLGTEVGGMLGNHPEDSAAVIFEVLNELKEQIRASHLKKIQVVAEDPFVFEKFLEEMWEIKNNRARARNTPNSTAYSSRMCVNLFL